MVQHAMQSDNCMHLAKSHCKLPLIVLIDNIMTYDVLAMASYATSLSFLTDFLAQFISIRWSDFIWGSSASRRH